MDTYADFFHAARDNQQQTLREILKKDRHLLNTRDSRPDCRYQPVIINGATALCYAAYNNAKDVIELLLSAGADVKISDETGETPLHKAAYNNAKGAIELLLNAGADVRTSDKKGGTPLHQAASSNAKDAIELLLIAGADTKAADNSGNTPLHYAVYNDANDAIELLLSAGADVKMAGRYGDTPLHVASCKNAKDTIKWLLSAGADVNNKNCSQETPLHKAARNNAKDAIELLLCASADVTTVDDCGETPLHKAAYNNAKGAFELLLSAGGDVKTPDIFGEITLLKKSNDTLRGILRSLSLPISGNKTELIKRIMQAMSDKANAPNTLQSKRKLDATNETSKKVKLEGEATTQLGTKLYNAFLSHRKRRTDETDMEDSEQFAILIKEVLVSKGFTVFLDKDDLKIIDEDNLRQKVQQSCSMLIIVDPKVTESPWCQMEWNWAIENKIPIFLVYNGDFYNLQVARESINKINSAGCAAALKHQALKYSGDARQSFFNQVEQLLKDTCDNSLPSFNPRGDAKAEWECLACTLLNPAQVTSCGCCGTFKGADHSRITFQEYSKRDVEAPYVANSPSKPANELQDFIKSLGVAGLDQFFREEVTDVTEIRDFELFDQDDWEKMSIKLGKIATRKLIRDLREIKKLSITGNI